VEAVLVLWTGWCVDLAKLLAGKKYRAASARMAGMGAFERIMISEARNARAFSTLIVGSPEGK
jgi:hypothetical protein